MHTIRLTPLEEDTGTRLDSFLSRRVEGLTPLRRRQGCWRRAASPVMAPSPAKATASPAGRSCA